MANLVQVMVKVLDSQVLNPPLVKWVNPAYIVELCEDPAGATFKYFRLGRLEEYRTSTLAADIATAANT